MRYLSDKLFLQRELASAGDGSVANVTKGFNNFSSNNTVDITLTADNDAGTAAISDVFLLAGKGDATRKTLPAGVTMSGDYDNETDLLDYLQNIGSKVQEIMLQTNDTANFGYGMELADATPNQRNIQYKRIDLAGYRQPNGNGFADTINIKNNPFYIVKQTILKLKLKKNTNIRVVFFMPEIETSADTTPVNF